MRQITFQFILFNNLLLKGNQIDTKYISNSTYNITLQKFTKMYREFKIKMFYSLTSLYAIKDE